jgi:hypothetical protein
MRRMILVPRKNKRREGVIRRYSKLTAYSTLAYSVLSGLLLVGMIYTIYQQKGFNKKQLELYELSIAPYIFVEFDSLLMVSGYNVFYDIKNVGNSPALSVVSACQITTNKKNPFKDELISEVIGEVFPGTSKWCESKQPFEPKDILYLHFRVDFKDFRKHKYYYKMTALLKFQTPSDKSRVFQYEAKGEYSEYGSLDR